MKFDIFATFTCVSRPCFDFSVIFFTPSSTLESVIGSYFSVIIIIFNALILICGGLLHLSPICQCVFNFKPAVWVLSFWLLGFASSGSPGFKMMVCKNYDLWSSYSTYISQTMTIMFLTIGGASRKRGAGSSSTHEDLKLGEKPAGGIASLKKASYNFFFF